MAFYDKAASKTTKKTKKSAKKPILNVSNKSQTKIIKQDLSDKSDLEKGNYVNLLKGLKTGEEVRTILDNILAVVRENDGKLKFEELAEKSKLSKERIKYYVNLLNKSGVVEVYYPTNPFASPEITIKADKLELMDFREKEMPEDKKTSRIIHSYC